MSSFNVALSALRVVNSFANSVRFDFALRVQYADQSFVIIAVCWIILVNVAGDLDESHVGES